LVGFAVLASAQTLGCATPEQRHRVLALFFDGVPPLHPEEAEPTPEEVVDREGPAGPWESTELPMVSVHGPVAKKECEQCHMSARSNRLVEPKQDLCWSCHDREDFPGEVVHGPVAAGFCDACHDPHRSPYRFLLVRALAELCDGCHDQSSFAAITEHRTAKGDDCQRCHDPHAGDRRFMLKSDDEAS
jgi:predicted CXXCH cytochrome family protein